MVRTSASNTQGWPCSIERAPFALMVAMGKRRSCFIVRAFLGGRPGMYIRSRVEASTARALCVLVRTRAILAAAARACRCHFDGCERLSVGRYADHRRFGPARDGGDGGQCSAETVFCHFSEGDEFPIIKIGNESQRFFSGKCYSITRSTGMSRHFPTGRNTA